jgi:hypothetical protein
MCNILTDKYIYLGTVEGWIKRPSRSIQNVSIIWKAMGLAFPLVAEFTSVES